MKIKSIKQVVEEIVKGFNCEQIEFTSNSIKIKNVYVKKTEIQSLVILMDCTVSSFEMTRNGKFETKYKQDGVYEDKGVYCPTDMYTPSGEFTRKTWEETEPLFFQNVLEITL